MLITTDRGGDPYRSLIESVERDVLFVAINGQPFYGTTKLMRAAGATRAEPIRVGPLRRLIVLVYPGIPDADMSWAEVLADIADAVRDPVARFLKIEKLHQLGTPPPWLQTDKPWDSPAVTGQPVPVTVRIPPLDALTHTTPPTSTPSSTARCTAAPSTAYATSEMDAAVKGAAWVVVCRRSWGRTGVGRPVRWHRLLSVTLRSAGRNRMTASGRQVPRTRVAGLKSHRSVPRVLRAIAAGRPTPARL